MYRLYEKVPKSDNYKYGIKILPTYDNPFQDGPTLLSLITNVNNLRDINGILKYSTSALRLNTPDNNISPYSLNDFNGRILTLAYCSPSESSQNSSMPTFSESISRLENLDSEFTKRYLYPLVESNGKRLDLFQAMKNIRNINILAFCGSMLSALKFEESLSAHMRTLNYSENEISQILSQMCIFSYGSNILYDSEFSHHKKIMATTLDFTDANDRLVQPPSDLRSKARKESIFVYNDRYIFFDGTGDHNVKEYLQPNNCLSILLSKTITHSLSNSIQNHNTPTQFKPINSNIFLNDINKIIDMHKKGVPDDEFLDLINNSIEYDIYPTKSSPSVFDEEPNH